MTAKQKQYVLDICQRLNEKLNSASMRLECGSTGRTILNIGCDEHTVLVWALREYWDKVEKCEVKENG